MHFLQKELEDNETLRAAVNSVSEQSAANKVKQGLILDLNPFWLSAFRLQDSGQAQSMPSSSDMWEFGSPFWQGLIRFDSGRLPDLNFKTPAVSKLTSNYLGRSVPSVFQPYVLRLAAKPHFTFDLDDDNKELSYENERDSLLEIARGADILTVVETHPLPELLSNPGSRITSSSGLKGTLGGYVKDANSNSILGMTCGHVVTKSALNSSGQHIGFVMHSKKPVPLPTNIHCMHTCGHVTNLDVALIDTHNSSPNVASSVATLIGNGQPVDMKGATTRGIKKYEIGGHVVEYEIGGSCWEKLIQFHAPTTGVTPVAYNVATTALPKPGDSGAWLIRNNTDWAGMVVASNSLFGFALSSTSLINESDASFGTKLSLA